MKMKKILVESVFKMSDKFDVDNMPLTKDEIRELKDLIRDYKSFNPMSSDEVDLLELSKTLSKLAEKSKRYIDSMDDYDDLDKTILKKDIKTIEDSAKEFTRVSQEIEKVKESAAIEIKKLKKKLLAAYEDMGIKYTRYFEID